MDLIDLKYWPHWLAAGWYLACWLGYTRYATAKAKTTPCLASVLHLYREDWMRRMLMRDNRIADTSVVGNLERNASFFASSTLIILAGVFTVFGASEKALVALSSLPLVEQADRSVSEIKLLGLAMVFVYAFFTFSWCMRQYNFAAILLGSAPMVAERNVTEQERKLFVQRSARVISSAANQFNLGLRAYYFGLAMMVWFINPWLFIAASTVVMFVLYHREFHSSVLEVMMASQAPQLDSKTDAVNAPLASEDTSGSGSTPT
ncbi:DUF599 domain-containing protein [Atopomonas sediminilitoris]|uniref:DUF599 domain-containing protein n=1 Tax=Atopomonas sediminilitoris TaxID=2919919 RepID=UPI001F4DC3B4|nr:DUF599 family protein [Atopomonas sediminilitoris]MCJ8168994.1 DUF599 family protein [Atopomonas sediminilitoris]